MADVSVLIVTWNSEEDIQRCMDSVIRNAKDLSVEIIVVDNNSSDRSFEIASRQHHDILHVYKNNANTGYTKAVNQAARYSTGKNILLLNPDAVLDDGVITKLSRFLDSNADYDACAPLMVNEDGSLQNSIRNFPDYWKMFCEFSLLAYIFPKSKMLGSWKMKYFGYDVDTDVEQPMAAALMLRSSSINKEQLFDEQYEMFFNDVDLCKTVHDRGKKIKFLHDVRVFHKHGVSIKKDRIRMIKIWNKDCVRYFAKHKPNAILLLWLKINLKFTEIVRIIYHKIKS